MSNINWNATLYDQKHAFVFEYGKDLLSLLDVQPGERILDLGCGTGHLTKQLADMGASPVGLDSSPSMVEKARQTYPEVEFVVADGRDFAFPDQFDAIFSNAVLHWISEPERVVISMAKALKPGGRLVVEMGGHGNVAAIVEATRQAIRELLGQEVTSGWYFPSIGEYSSLLEMHGLEVRYAHLFDRPTLLDDGEQGLRIWLRMFGERMLQKLTAEQQEQILSVVEQRVRPQLFRDGHWFADYRRLRILALKKASF